MTTDKEKKIGIMGISYGGYATLAGVTFMPDLYAAAIDPRNLLIDVKPDDNLKEINRP